MMGVPVADFGKDHWSTFAYTECCTVDSKGVLDPRRMRCDFNRRPGLFATQRLSADRKYPTILAGGRELPDHDDWDCLDDLEAAGLLQQVGTGVNPVVRLTDAGHEAAAALRRHKAQGGNFAGFHLQG